MIELKLMRVTIFCLAMICIALFVLIGKHEKRGDKLEAETKKLRGLGNPSLEDLPWKKMVPLKPGYRDDDGKYHPPEQYIEAIKNTSKSDEEIRAIPDWSVMKGAHDKSKEIEKKKSLMFRILTLDF